MGKALQRILEKLLSYSWLLQPLLRGRSFLRTSLAVLAVVLVLQEVGPHIQLLSDDWNHSGATMVKEVTSSRATLALVGAHTYEVAGVCRFDWRLTCLALPAEHQACVPKQTETRQPASTISTSAASHVVPPDFAALNDRPLQAPDFSGSIFSNAVPRPSPFVCAFISVLPWQSSAPWWPFFDWSDPVKPVGYVGMIELVLAQPSLFLFILWRCAVVGPWSLAFILFAVGVLGIAYSRFRPTSWGAWLLLPAITIGTALAAYGLLYLLMVILSAVVGGIIIALAWMVGLFHIGNIVSEEAAKWRSAGAGLQS
jgi:hypothetical protein